MTNKINWIELLQQNEEAILEAGKQAYRDACSSHYDNSFNNTEDVVINQYGEVRNQTMQKNWDSMDCREGTAMVVISFNKFNPWEDESEDDIIIDTLEAEELAEFKSWLKENDIVRFDRRDLETWNSEIAGRIDDEYVSAYIDDTIDEQVNNQFEQCIEGLKAIEGVI